MNRAHYINMRDEHLEKALKINRDKGADYASEGDVLDNFKRHAVALNLTPEVVWAVYASKHWDAIISFCADGEVKSEPIEGRLHDIIVYSMLLLGLIEDRRQAECVKTACDDEKDLQVRCHCGFRPAWECECFPDEDDDNVA